jgi:hypothetical protein
VLFINECFLHLCYFYCRVPGSCCKNNLAPFTFTSLNQEVALEEMKKELLARPTEKLVDDLHKKVKILQVVRSLLCY